MSALLVTVQRVTLIEFIRLILGIKAPIPDVSQKEGKREGGTVGAGKKEGGRAEICASNTAFLSVEI